VSKWESMLWWVMSPSTPESRKSKRYEHVSWRAGCHRRERSSVRLAHFLIRMHTHCEAVSQGVSRTEIRNAHRYQKHRGNPSKHQKLNRRWTSPCDKTEGYWENSDMTTVKPLKISTTIFRCIHVLSRDRDI